MILEVFSISLIIPVLSVIENKNFLEKNLPNLDFIQNLDHIDQIYLIISILCIVFIIKTIFVLFLNYQQNKYTTFLQAKISELLMFTPPKKTANSFEEVSSFFASSAFWLISQLAIPCSSFTRLTLS